MKTARQTARRVHHFDAIVSGFPVPKGASASALKATVRSGWDVRRA